MTDAHDSDSSDSANDAVDTDVDVADAMEGDEATAADAATLEEAGIEPLDDIFDDVPIAPGNEGLDTKTDPGWGVEYHGQMTVGEELEDVTFNFKNDENGNKSHTLISEGHLSKADHDDQHQVHVFNEDTDNPGYVVHSPTILVENQTEKD